MLNAMRKNAGGWAAKILIALLVLSFAIWGVGDMFNMTGRQQLAEVGSREISALEFQRSYQNQLNMVSNQFRRRLTSAEAKALGLVDRVIQNLVGTTAIDIHADQLKLGIDDKTVADSVTSEPAFRGPSGQFNRAAFEEVLRANNLNEQGFLVEQRQEMVRNQLVNTLGSEPYVPKTLVDAVNHYQNDERVLAYFPLSAEAAGTVAAPDESALKSYYEENKTSFRAPEYRKISLLSLLPEQIKETISVSDEDLKTSFETTKSQYMTPERRTIQQLIFKDKAAAEEASKKLKEGTDFLALGKELGLKEDDINLGNFAKDKLADQTIAETAFKLELNKPSEPIESFSPVIVRVTEIAPGSQKTFEEVKDQVRDQVAQTRVAEEISKLYDSIEDERAGGATLSEIATKLNLKYSEPTLDRQGRDQSGKEVAEPANNPAAVKLVFESDVGVENNAVAVGEGYVFIDVVEIIPERQKEFDEIREDVSKAWTANETRELLRKKSDELIAKIKGGEALEAVAKSVGATVTTSPPLKRDAQQEGLPQGAISEVFTMDLNAANSAETQDRNSRVVFQLKEIKPAAPLAKEDADKLRNDIARGLTVDILSQYVGGLRDNYGVQVNPAAIAAVVGQ